MFASAHPRDTVPGWPGAPGYYGAVEPCRFDRFESVGSHSTVESHAIEFRMTDEHHPGQKPVQFLADLRQRRARPHRLRADPMKRNIQGIELHLWIESELTTESRISPTQT